MKSNLVLNLVLNQTGSKFFVKFSEDFTNSKN
jgi:hypothetical protein